MTSASFLDARERAHFEAFHVSRRYALQTEKTEHGRTLGMTALVDTALARGSGLVVEQKILAIQARAGQGLTWAAEEVLEATAKADPPWKRILTLNARTALGTMLDASGWRPVCRALRPHGLTVAGREQALANSTPLLLLAAAVALSAACWLAIARASYLMAGPLLLTAAVVLCTSGWWLTSRMLRARILARLAWALGDPRLPDAAVTAAGCVLGREVTRAEVFTVVVVDDYSRLPAPARAAIVEALRGGPLGYAVTWLVFDSGSPGLLRNALDRFHDSGAEGISVLTCEMQPMSSEERAHVARIGGVPAVRARTDEDLFAALAESRHGSDPVGKGPAGKDGSRAAA